MINNDFLFLSGTQVSNIDDLYIFIKALEADEQLYSMYIERQKHICNLILFERPVRNLLKKSGKLLNQRFNQQYQIFNNEEYYFNPYSWKSSKEIEKNLDDNDND